MSLMFAACPTVRTGDVDMVSVAYLVHNPLGERVHTAPFGSDVPCKVLFINVEGGCRVV